MELYYLFIIISVIISAKSEAFVLNTDDTTVKSQKSKYLNISLSTNSTDIFKSNKMYLIFILRIH